MKRKSPDFRLKGKKIWVTGAGGGIGRAVVQMARDSGAKVTGFDLPGGTEDWHPLDLREPDGIRRVVREHLFHGDRPDVLVLASGFLFPSEAEILPLSQWDDMFAVNCRGPFCLIRELVPALTSSDCGAIVCVGSNAGHVPRWGMAGYGASKAALKYLTLTLGLELAGKGVTCNLVSPGSTDTNMLQQLWQKTGGSREETLKGSLKKFRTGIPDGKIARPEDIAQAVLFLASDGARHITMQDLVVDGGASLGL